MMRVYYEDSWGEYDNDFLCNQERVMNNESDDMFIGDEYTEEDSQDEKEENNFEYNDQIIKAYQKYNAGQITREELYNELYVNLEKLVNYFYNRRFYSVHGSSLYEDMFQAAMVGIFNKADKYEIAKGRPATFFAYQIKASFRKAYDDMFGLNDYNRKYRKIEQIAKQLGYPCAEDVPLGTIKALTKWEYETIRNTLKYANVKVVSLDKKNDEGDDLCNTLASYGDDPQDLFLAKEKRNTLFAHLDKLTPFDQWLVTMVYFEEMSLQQVLIAYNNMPDEEKRERFGTLLKKPSTRNLQFYLNNIKRRLRHSNLRAISDFVPEDNMDYEQADESDIAGCILLDDIF